MISGKFPPEIPPRNRPPSSAFHRNLKRHSVRHLSDKSLGQPDQVSQRGFTETASSSAKNWLENNFPCDQASGKLMLVWWTHCKVRAKQLVQNFCPRAINTYWHVIYASKQFSATPSLNLSVVTCIPFPRRDTKSRVNAVFRVICRSWWCSRQLVIKYSSHSILIFFSL